MKIGLEKAPNGEVTGIDPRKMTVSELGAMGHVKTPLSKVIRLKCLDCAHTENEVRKCTSVTCALWPYRMRKNPFSERTVSDGAKNALANWRADNRKPKTAW